uniref:Uncharacterized protein n=1 Tax=mine drainage metagenome TaxID=410659 RepID=E6PGY5_9ZZZZ
MRKLRYLLAALLATAVLTLPTLAPIARAAAAHPLMTPRPPSVPLHTEFVVEVNRLGQVVRIMQKHGCKDLNFNAHTLGNVLQMWIRRPDGTAVVGLYRVTFDYNPHTHGINRHVALVRAGGNWGNDPGAANQMIEDAKRLQQEHEHPNLPSLKKLLKPTPKPTHHPSR